MSANPFHDFGQFALQVCEEERARDCSAGRLRRPLAEVHAHVTQREIELQRHRARAMKQGAKTGHDQSEVERRIVALFDLCRKLLLWERDAPRLTDEQLRERELSCAWTSDPASDYLVDLLNRVPPALEQVNDLAAAYEGQAYNPFACPGCGYDLTDHERQLPQYTCPKCSLFQFHSCIFVMPVTSNQPQPPVKMQVAGPYWEPVAPPMSKPSEGESEQAGPLTPLVAHPVTSAASNAGTLVGSLLSEAELRQEGESEAERIRGVRARLLDEQRASRARLTDAFEHAVRFPGEESQRGQKPSTEAFSRWAQRFLALSVVMRTCEQANKHLRLIEKLRTAAESPSPAAMKYGCAVLLLASEGNSDAVASALERANSDATLRRFVAWLPFILDRLWHPFPSERGLIEVAGPPEGTSREEMEQAEQAFGWRPHGQAAERSSGANQTEVTENARPHEEHLTETEGEPGARATIGELLVEIESKERAAAANAREADRIEAEQGSLVAQHYRLQAAAYEQGPDVHRMPGVERLVVLCDELFGGTGLTVANVRQLRARLCRKLRWRPTEVDALTLEQAGDVLEGIERVSFDTFNALMPQLVLDPFTTIDYVGAPGPTPVLWASCFIVPGTVPSVCPNADPCLPEMYLPLVVGVFKRFPKRFPEGNTVHWIGHNAWRRNACTCALPSKRIAIEPPARPAEAPSIGGGPAATVEHPDSSSRKPLAVEQTQDMEYVFSPSGNGYYIAGFGESGHVKGLKGLHRIARLLQTAGEPVPMVELYASAVQSQVGADKHSAQPALGKEAIDAARNEYRELQAECERAKDDNDPASAAVAERELAEFRQRWQRDLKLGGRPRDLNNPLDKMRPAIWKTLQKAFEALKTASPPMTKLAEHFEQSISSEGGAFLYRPNSSPSWKFEKPRP